MEKLVDDGLVKHLGVSNFSAKQVEDLLQYARIKPVINQVELHPLLAQRKLVGTCARKVKLLHAQALHIVRNHITCVHGCECWPQNKEISTSVGVVLGGIWIDRCNQDQITNLHLARAACLVSHAYTSSVCAFKSFSRVRMLRITFKQPCLLMYAGLCQRRLYCTSQQ